MPQADALRRIPPQGIVPLQTGPAETHGWDAAFTRLLGRYTRIMGRPATLERRIRDVR
jgi:hypothetical protein